MRLSHDLYPLPDLLEPWEVLLKSFILVWHHFSQVRLVLDLGLRVIWVILEGYWKACVCSVQRWWLLLMVFLSILVQNYRALVHLRRNCWRCYRYCVVLGLGWLVKVLVKPRHVCGTFVKMVRRYSKSGLTWLVLVSPGFDIRWNVFFLFQD